METIVEIVVLAIKNDIVPKNGILTGVFTESETDILIDVSKAIEDKTIESKIVELKTILTTEEHKIVKHAILSVDDADSGTKEEVGCSLVD